MSQTVTIDNLPARMKNGQAVRAPEFLGCCNTGRRPVIAKPKILSEKTYKALNPKGFRFIVGPELYLQDALKRMLLGKATHKTLDAPIIHGPGTGNVGSEDYRVRFFKSYRSARKYFIELWGKQVESNKRIAADYKHAEDKTKSSDPITQLQGAIDMLDHM